LATRGVATLTDDKLVGAGEPVVIGAAWSTCSSGCVHQSYHAVYSIRPTELARLGWLMMPLVSVDSRKCRRNQDKRVGGGTTGVDSDEGLRGIDVNSGWSPAPMLLDAGTDCEQARAGDGFADGAAVD